MMDNSKFKFCKLAAVLMMATALSGCNTWSRLSNIGKEPDLAPIQNPVEAPGYQAVSMPMPPKPERITTFFPLVKLARIHSSSFARPINRPTCSTLDRRYGFFSRTSFSTSSNFFASVSAFSKRPPARQHNVWRKIY